MPLVRWSLYKYKYLWVVGCWGGGGGQGPGFMKKKKKRRSWAHPLIKYHILYNKIWD